MIVLVSGGTGRVGRHIVAGLAARGHAMIVGTRRPEDVRGLPARSLLLDPAGDFSAAFEGVDAFVHAAFEHVPGRYRGGEGDDPAGFSRANLAGSVALFETARRAGVQRAVFLSSRAVYGPRAPGTVLSEDQPCRPDTLYGSVKLAAEEALAELASPAFVTASLRVTGVYGQPEPGADHKWRTLLADFLAGRPIAPRIGTEVHGEDVAAAVALMLEAPAGAVAVRCFNVSDILLDRRDLLRQVRRLAGVSHPLPRAAEPHTINVMDCGRLRALGWKPGGIAKLEASLPAMLEGR